LTNLYFGESSSYGETPQFKADTIGGVVTYDFSRPLIKPEHLFDAELGARYMSSLFRGSATVYWMEFSD
jgi:iron complex outermembrane receptor protein